MDKAKIKVIAMDLDGTLTQHKQPLPLETRAALTALSRQYKLLMVGAGQVQRIFNQMEKFPIDIIGNYGLQYGTYNAETGEMDIQRNLTLPQANRDEIEKKVAALREKYGFTQYAGENVEYHVSGCVTFPLLGTAAKIEDKLAFDPDRKKRSVFYQDVKETFPDYTVFIGGSSSFDFAPFPYNKYYALDRFCKDNGLRHDQVVYVGDDYGPGGNDESVYVSDFPFICVDDYTRLDEYLKDLL